MISRMRVSNKRWTWLCAAVIALTLLLAMLPLNGSFERGSAQAAPPAQSPQDLCSLFPPGEGFKIEKNEGDKGCSVSYKYGYYSITAYPSAEQARQAVSDQAAIYAEKPKPGTTTVCGEYGFELPEEHTTPICRPWDRGDGTVDTLCAIETGSLLTIDSHTYTLVFSRGCYAISTQAESENPEVAKAQEVDKNWMGPKYVPGAAEATRKTAAQVDAKLKALPPCPGAAAQPQPPAVAGPFSVGFVCGYNEPPYSPGQVSCAASTTNAPPDAEIEYKWFMDGVQQPEKGNTFARDDKDLAPGEHSITVYAVDWTDTQSEGASYRFTKPGAPAAQPPAAPSAGQVVVKTSSGTTTVNPGTKTQIQLRPGEKAELEARCAEIKSTIVLMAAVEPKLEFSALVIAYLMVKIKCNELLSSQPLALAMAGGSNNVFLSHLSIADKPVQVQIELQQGPLRVEVIHDAVALDVETATTIVSSVGKNTLGVEHDPNTGTSIVSAYQGTVSIQPKNLALSPTTLQTGQRVEVTQSNVGAVTPIETPGSAAGALALVICGGVPFLMLAALVGGVVVFRRSRSRRARPSPPPPSGIPERGQRPSDLPERGAQPGLPATCPHCKSPVRAGAKFCSQCGKRIA